MPEIQCRGQLLIAGQWLSGDGAALEVRNPRTGELLVPEYRAASTAQAQKALLVADDAFARLRGLSAHWPADLLERIAEVMEGHREKIIERASQETGLPAEPRLQGEFVRTTNQLCLMAQVVREGSWVSATIDPAQPDRKPLPRADIRSMLVPLGPVVVFDASNFPLAFGSAGNDVASALAAGNPVVVKTHSLHPGTDELVAGCVQQAIAELSLPVGTYALLHGSGREIGTTLVSDPRCKAVGFTGSGTAGRALFDLANRRQDPIPVFAEMGSLNPIILLPGAIQSRGSTIATGLAQSLTLGVGQFCTKPGIILMDASASSTDSFLHQISDILVKTAPAVMLSADGRDAFCKATDTVGATEGVRVRVKAAPSGFASVTPFLAEVSTDQFLRHPELREELFGPGAVVVRCQFESDYLDALRILRGSLTCTIHWSGDDAPDLVARLIDSATQMAGRVVANGFPTGVEVGQAMVHGGPWPASSAPSTTSVGTNSIRRFTRPVAFQNMTQGGKAGQVRLS